jgi:hypothetical protein
MLAKDSTATICTSPEYGIRPILFALPFWLRLLQSLRRFADSRQANPHLLNAGKYLSSIFVVLFSSLAAAYRRTVLVVNVVWDSLRHSYLGQ